MTESEQHEKQMAGIIHGFLIKLLAIIYSLLTVLQVEFFHLFRTPVVKVIYKRQWFTNSKMDEISPQTIRLLSHFIEI